MTSLKRKTSIVCRGLRTPLIYILSSMYGICSGDKMQPFRTHRAEESSPRSLEPFEPTTHSSSHSNVNRPEANGTDHVNHDLVQMIANYVNDQHDTWDQFLREFAYAIRTAVNEATVKTLAELFFGRKLITPFQKLVMVSDGTEFVVGDIERLFDEGRRNTKDKHEKWEKIIIDEGVM
ncbi:uncharacterized protein TNCV_2029511 [Trichonephila clavipes]|nr:uncharacterized protein TNCV_2029511 [Trichonephila clavipes]